MGMNVKSLGVKEWIFQRLSNVAFVVFGIWLLYFLASPGDILFETLVKLSRDSASVIYFSATLLLAGFNSILAGWQIVGDYANKFGLNQNLLVSLISIISLGYIAVGIYILHF